MELFLRHYLTSLILIDSPLSLLDIHFPYYGEPEMKLRRNIG